MPKTRSINQNNPGDTLPNFRNLGVVLRIIILINVLALLAGIFQANSWSDVGEFLMQGSAYLQPVLLMSLLLLNIGNAQLARLPYWQGVAGVLGIVMFCAIAIAYLGSDLLFSNVAPASLNLFKQLALSVALTTLLLGYFRMRSLSLSPALAEARLQALQARIRPHFLFNSINAVLGIVRSDPKRAETALEDMADLFRMAMSNNSELLPLLHEIELTRQYLALEQLRMGERLKVTWQIAEMPADALIPPFILQPLLENAVYHGIEPRSDGGEIIINIYFKNKELYMVVSNPRSPEKDFATGNKIALANIRERLALQFDAEASYNVEADAHYYRVHIVIPYIKEETR
ncbi:MAG: histidine kinase [Gallionellaceae bacterium]|jgi:two-component system sensor histidine kinase AlgZ